MKKRVNHDKLAELFAAGVLGLVLAVIMTFCLTRVEPELAGLIIPCSVVLGILMSWGLLKTWRGYGVRR